MRSRAQLPLALFAVLIWIVTRANGHGGGKRHVRHDREAVEILNTEQAAAKQRQLVDDDLNNNNSNIARCGTPEITDDIRQGGQLALEFQQFKLDRAKNKTTTTSGGNQAEEEDDNIARISLKEIPVCFHVIGRGLQRQISRRQLNKNLIALNKAYSGSSCCDPSQQSWCVPGSTGTFCSPDTNIRYVMAKVLFKRILRTTARTPLNLFACVKRRFQNVDLQDKTNEQVVKEAMHVGDGRVLNIYIGTLSFSLGYATLPSGLLTKPVYMDGVVIDRNTTVGSANPKYNEGDTLAHEVGHWLGLYHTFERGCFPGDRIDDTPAEARAYYGCATSPDQRDTCPDAPGLDPIHNFMDYSDDSCLYLWSPGQVETMHANIDFFRLPFTPDLQPVPLTNGAWSSETYTLAKGFIRQFYIDAPTSSYVYCDTRAALVPGGDIDLYMNWDGGLASFDCSSENPASSTEDCELTTPNSGRAYAWVFGVETTVDFEIKCYLL